MKRLTLTQKEFREVAELLPWAEAVDFTVWFTGEQKRWKRTEYNLPRMVKKGALKSLRYGRRYVYAAAPSKARNVGSIAHDLACTKALLRLKTSNGVDFVSENYFRQQGFEAVPEWGAIYEQSNSNVFFELSKADNFRRRGLMNKKITQYKDSLFRFEEHFGKRPLVLFVYEAPEYAIRNFLEGKEGLEAFYFTDYESFFSAPQGQQLTVPIYIWGGDGKKYPIGK